MWPCSRAPSDLCLETLIETTSRRLTTLSSWIRHFLGNLQTCRIWCGHRTPESRITPCFTVSLNLRIRTLKQPWHQSTRGRREGCCSSGHFQNLFAPSHLSSWGCPWVLSSDPFTFHHTYSLANLLYSRDFKWHPFFKFFSLIKVKVT